MIITEYPVNVVLWGNHGIKGGGGKSTALALECKWLERLPQNVRIGAFDIDGETSTFGRLCKGLDIEELKRRDTDGFDRLVEAALSGNYDVILYDTPASSKEDMVDFYKTIEPEILESFGIRVVCNTVINPRPDSINVALDWLRCVPEWVNNFAIYNFMTNAIGLPEETLSEIKQKTFAQMFIPEYAEKIHKPIDKADLTWFDAYEMAYKHNRAKKDEKEKLFIEEVTTGMSEMRLNRQVKVISNQLDENKAMFLPDHILEKLTKKKPPVPAKS